MVAGLEMPHCNLPWLTNPSRAEFDRNMAIDKRNFAAIEFLLRKGRRQLDTYAAPGIKDIR